MKLRNVSTAILITAASAIIAIVAMAGDDAATYLILNDISPYSRITAARDIVTDKLKTIPGYTINSGSGILAGADHFVIDHSDITYETDYQSKELGLGIEVQVTKHAGTDSDKWLLHEVEVSYRDSDNSDNRFGLLSGAGIKVREISGNKFIYWGLGGGSYTWISGKKVVEIKYTDLQRTKTEPIEVVQAYLQKHPSSIPSTFVFDQAHDIQWIKDEIERRLWLCDKWFYQLQLEKVQQGEALQAAIRSMNIFLDYREKYFGVKAANEKNLLAGFLNTNNGTKIKAKQEEYKRWWAANKSSAISL
jgi:hypothetical protein